jgi:hypothetical protein
MSTRRVESINMLKIPGRKACTQMSSRPYTQASGVATAMLETNFRNILSKCIINRLEPGLEVLRRV